MSVLDKYKLIPPQILKAMFPREKINEEKFKELVKSIKESDVVEPLIVREVNGEYVVVAGYRRLLAALKAGALSVPCVVKRMSDEEAYRTSLVENLNREELEDYELAKRLKEFKDKFGYSTTELGRMLGKSQSWIVLHLNILKAEEVITRVISESPALSESVKPGEVMGKVTERHARAVFNKPEPVQSLLAGQIASSVSQKKRVPSARKLEEVAQDAAELPEETQLEVAEKVVDEKLKIAETEVLVHALQENPERRNIILSQPIKTLSEIVETEEQLEELITQTPEEAVMEAVECPHCAKELWINWIERRVYPKEISME